MNSLPRELQNIIYSYNEQLIRVNVLDELIFTVKLQKLKKIKNMRIDLLKKYEIYYSIEINEHNFEYCYNLLINILLKQRLLRKLLDDYDSI